VVFISRKYKDRQNNGQMKEDKTKGQTIIYKTLHRKLTNPTKDLGW
jgi:hypothetical protein